MNKAILVIDMPESCANCPLAYGNDISDWCLPMGNFNGDVYRHTTNSTKPDWCPLKPAPEEQLVWHDDDDWVMGCNNCVREIMGRGEDYE